MTDKEAVEILRKWIRDFYEQNLRDIVNEAIVDFYAVGKERALENVQRKLKEIEGRESCGSK